jgi:hypothetical protein
MAATYVKYQCFVGDIGLGVHNLNGTNYLKLALSNRAPVVESDALIATAVPITEQNGYAAASIANAYSQSGGVGTLTGTTVVWTGTTTSPAFGPFRYVILYNATASNGPLIAYWDYGSSISINQGETFTVTIGANVFTLT